MSSRPPLSGVVRAAFAVAGHELRSSLRDRQAMVYAILMPLALYPVLFWVMLQGALVIEGQRERTEVSALVAGTAEPGERDALASALTDPAPGEAPGPIVLQDPADAPDPVALLRSGDLDAMLVMDRADLPADAAAVLEEDEEEAPEGATFLLYDGSKSRSSLALDRGEARLGTLAFASRVAAVDGDPARLEAFRLEGVSFASELDKSAFILSFLLPMMFCIMAVMGGFFPAVDLSAGEKERGTVETTMLLPVPRVATLLGKILCVSVFALIATTLNISGLMLAAQHLLSGLDANLNFEVPWAAFPLAAPLLLGFLVSTSAILFAVASFADTFKQGQSLLGPVQMFVIFPAVIVAMPGIELTPGLALVPVAQTALAFKAVLQGDASALELGLVGASEMVYAVVAVVIALKLSSNEARALGGGPKKKKSKRKGGLAALFARK